MAMDTPMYRVLAPGKQQGALNTWSVMAGGNRIASCQREDSAHRIVNALNEMDLLKRAGYIIAMRLMQSKESLDDRERAALDAFITKENIRSAIGS